MVNTLEELPSRPRCAAPPQHERGQRAKSFEYHRPASLNQALELLGGGTARLLAGGTDVLVRLRDGRLRPAALVSLSHIRELSHIELGAPIRIGAMARIAEVLENQALCQLLPALAEAAQTLGGAQVRNLATIGGNICNASPCADTAPPLLIQEARVRIVSTSGSREVPLDDFFVAPGQTRLAPGEVLTEVMVDRPAAGTRSTFIKKGRVRMDIAIASIAASVVLDGGRCVRARLAAGSLGPRPMRLRAVEAAILGRVLDGSTLAAARSAAEGEVTPITDLRGTADYRRHLAGALVVRALMRLNDWRGP